MNWPSYRDDLIDRATDSPPPNRPKLSYKTNRKKPITQTSTYARRSTAFFKSLRFARGNDAPTSCVTAW
jgi:hypothetical protein